jgi:hypothetical protein
VAFLLALAGTAFLAPNTLATIGPEALGLERGSSWWLPLLGSSSVVSTLVVYAFIRLKGWIPRARA